ncbi:MAG TPA: ribosome biogenesis GTPase Der [Patescibacteria group bacterium]|jgi:GTP-binding protein|nr:ribosome biogenesis GTPase Der [Patescibacteria group bacterium]
MSKYIWPQVVLIGRTNVGKSTLFNRIAKDAKSIVFDRAGVTRDLVKDIVSWQGKSFELIDSGGIGFEKKDDFMSQEIRRRAEQALETAHTILFMCDGSIGVLPEDRYLAKMVHKKSNNVVLLINKTDTRSSNERMHEFAQLGFAHSIPISSIHGTGIADVLETIVSLLPSSATMQEESPTCKVVLLGKPNVGKSSLLNILVEEDRSIISDIPGTTREPIHERITFYQQDIILTDTAGVRKKNAIEDPLEELMAKSTLQAVKQADIVLLMIDANEAQLSDQELKLIFFAFESELKAVILLLNKQDLLLKNDYGKQLLTEDIEKYDFLIKKIEKISLSCITKQNCGKILPLVDTVHKRLLQQFSVEELTMLFKNALEKTPLFWNKNRLVVHRAQQIKSSPHIIALYVNNSGWFGNSQKAFFENVLRKAYKLDSVPIKFVIRKR